MIAIAGSTGVLVSGGLDSCILTGHLLTQRQAVHPFYIRTGVTWESAELAHLRRFCAAVASPNLRELVVLELPLRDVYDKHWSMTGREVPNATAPDEAVYLPGRNALLLVKAAVWCQRHRIDELALAPLGTSPFADASAESIAKFEAAINCGASCPVRIVLPFARMNKRQVMELGRQLSLPLEETFSCIAPRNGQHCGDCNKCEERRSAFRHAEISDPTRYSR